MEDIILWWHIWWEITQWKVGSYNLLNNENDQAVEEKKSILFEQRIAISEAQIQIATQIVP